MSFQNFGSTDIYRCSPDKTANAPGKSHHNGYYVLLKSKPRPPNLHKLPDVKLGRALPLRQSVGHIVVVRNVTPRTPPSFSLFKFVRE